MIIGAWRGQIWMQKEKTDEALKFFFLMTISVILF